MHAQSLLLAMSAFVGAEIGNKAEPTPPGFEYLFTVQDTESVPLLIGNGGHVTRRFMPLSEETFTRPNLDASYINSILAPNRAPL